MTKKIFLCLFFSFVFVLNTFAQDKDKAILLKEILEKITQKHNVNFNFIEEEIAVFKIIPPPENTTIEAKLDYISKKTQLQFHFISDKYISVVNNKKLDKPLCGFLIDSETNEPIEQATITILNLNSAVISNAKGYFEMNLKTHYNIQITHVNYEKLVLSTLDIYKETCPSLKLKPFATELKEVVTNVYLTKGISKKIDGSFEIKPKKFGLLPGLTEVDVFQTMQQIPGITSVEENISDINVRGGTHDQNLFMFNGIRLYQTGHFYGLISVLNPNLSHKINITKNGNSAFYSDGISSTILIETNNDINNNENSIGANLINIDANTTIKTSSKSYLEISARRSLTDFFQSPTYKNYYTRIFQNAIITNTSSNLNTKINTQEQFYFYDATLKFNQKINDKLDFNINLITISNQLDLLQNKTENNVVITKNSLLNQNNYGASFNINYKWNKNNSSQINSYVSYHEVISENQSIESNQVLNQENQVIDTQIQLKNSHKINETLVFNNGYQLNEIGVLNFDKVNSPLFSRKNKEVLHNHALIAELNYKSKNHNLYTTLGIRQNYFSQFNKFITEPRFYLNYSLSPTLKLDVSAELNHQTTSQVVDLQRDFLGLEKQRWVLANDNTIPIITSKQTSIGISFKKKNWLITLENYYKKVNNINSRSQNFQNQFLLSNAIGSFEVFGSEFLIQKQISKIISWISYSFTNNNYFFEAFSPSSFSNNYEIRHQINSGIVYEIKKLQMAVGAKWFTGKPTTLLLDNSINNNALNFDLPNHSNLKDYLQFNASASYKVEINEKSKLNFGLSAQNITNQKNVLNQFFQINSNSNQVEQVLIFGLKMTPNIFLRYNFK